MPYDQQPPILGKRAYGPGGQWADQGDPGLQDLQPNIDPALIKALAAILGSPLGQQQQPQFENALYEQDMRRQSPDPNALTGGMVEPGFDAFPSGSPQFDLGMQAPPVELPSELAPSSEATTAAPKKKGEFADFFKVLRAAKSGDKDIKKGFSELAKQLESPTAAEGGTVPVA